MAKVVIQGDVSGSVTLSTPTGALGTRTLTLPAASGNVLTDAATVTVSQGGTGLTSATAYAVLCGGTTSTDVLQSVASVGTSGQVLESNGAGALPTFQSFSSVTVNKITATGAGNWTIPSTGTYALVRAWGGGGGGGRGGSYAFIGAAGGGGGYSERTYKLSDLTAAHGATVPYSVGPGGAARASGGDGNPGTDTTFGTSAAGTLLTAYAGGAGYGNRSSTDTNAGGGGGVLSAGATAGTTNGGDVGGGNGETWTTQTGYGTPSHPWGGAGGGAYATGDGGNAFLGGAGGASGTTGGSGIGGKSVFGGNGGNQGNNPGLQPGGGGGGNPNNSGSSGKGGDGMIEIWVW